MTPSGTHTFRGDSADEADWWIAALREAAENLKTGGGNDVSIYATMDRHTRGRSTRSTHSSSVDRTAVGRARAAPACVSIHGRVDADVITSSGFQVLGSLAKGGDPPIGFVG